MIEEEFEEGIRFLLLVADDVAGDCSGVSIA